VEAGIDGALGKMELFKGTWKQWQLERSQADQAEIPTSAEAEPSAAQAEWERRRSARRRRRHAERPAEAGANFSTVANQLDWLRLPELLDSTAASDFDARGVCDGNTDLYVVVPPRLLEQARAWIRLWIAVPNAVAAERIGSDRPDLLIVLDEMPRLGYLKPVVDAFTTAAGAGLHFWCIAQTLSALEEAYGAKPTAMIVDNSELIQILGFPQTAHRDAERFSAAIGDATFRAPSGDGGPGGDGEKVVRERLVPVHDLLSMDSDTQYVVAAPRGLPRDALRLAHARHWRRRDVKGADANPYVLRKG